MSYTIFYLDNQWTIQSEQTSQTSQHVLLDKADFYDSLVHVHKNKLSQTKYKILSSEVSNTLQEIMQQFEIVSAAGGLVTNENDEYLVIHRLGKWDLPKGKIEANETPELAAVREVEEETGLRNIVLGEQLPTTYHLYPSNEQWILKPTYWYRMTAPSQTLTPQTEEAIEKVLWMNKTDFETEFMSNTYDSIEYLVERV